MSTITALQLMNRVMTLRHQPEAASYQSTNPEHVVTLNALNIAKEEILGSRKWEFDLRHDGQLITKASSLSREVASTMTTTAGSASATLDLDSLTASDELIGDWVARAIPTGSTDYTGTSFRVVNALASGATASVNFPFAVPVTLSAVECDVIWAEYILPDTVREVVRASYEEIPLSLTQASATASFDELVPAIGWQKGSPRYFSVGGYDLSTYDSSGTAPVPKQRAVVWPVPDDEYIVTYSYYYVHPDFEDGDSTLDGVPSTNVNDIVLLATSLVGMAWDNNWAMSHFADMANGQSTIKYMSSGGNRSQRYNMRSWDSSPRADDRVVGFPNRLLGGG